MGTLMAQRDRAALEESIAEKMNSENLSRWETFVQRMKAFVADLKEAIRKLAIKDRAVAAALNAQTEAAEMFTETFDRALQAVKNKKPAGDGGVDYSRDLKKITSDSTEEERETILRKKESFVAAEYTGQADKIISQNKSDLESGKRNLVKEVYRRAVDELGIPENLYNDDFEVEVKSSYGTFKETSHKKSADPSDIIRLIPIIQKAVKTAIGIEVHDNRYYADQSTVYFANLLGGFIDGDSFVPVRFGIKVRKDGTNSLYVLISDQKIKKSEVLTPGAPSKDGVPSGARSDFNINIARLTKKVNNRDIIKYLPDGFITEAQKKEKWNAIAETIRYTNDKNDRKYQQYIESGNIRAAAQMVKESAKRAGYTMHLYHGSRKGGGIRIFKNWQYFTENKVYAERYMQRDNADSLYDVYMKAERMFDTRRPECRKLFEKFRIKYGMSPIQASGLPDWTDGYDLSDIIEENDLPYDGIVLDEGGDKTEAGPVSRGPSYVIRESKQIKRADAITYDADGNVIPISQRFDVTQEDINYSKDLDVVAAERDEQYLAAVESGDMETTQRMVDEAADRKLKNSKMRTEDGKLRHLYHGTNTGAFYEFDPKQIGAESGDLGFFGNGFYFAYTSGEAKYYGTSLAVLIRVTCGTALALQSRLLLRFPPLDKGIEVHYNK